jgi:hypothetical protein
MHHARESVANRWPTLQPEALSGQSWQQLLRNDIPLLVIRGFATNEECERLVHSANTVGFGAYEDVWPPIDRIGTTVFERDRVGAEQYFADVQRLIGVQSAIFDRAFDPVERFMEMLAQATGASVSVARSSSGQRYYAGLVRRIEEGTRLHIDFAPADHPTWSVASVVSQLSWNLYLEVGAQDSGRTHVYDRMWQPLDERFKLPHSYGYSDEVVADVARATFAPTIGDVYVFNTRNYHRVDPSCGHRTTVTSAVGQYPDGSLALWS